MSDETRAALEEATAKVEALRAQLRQQQMDVLREVAAGLPAHVEDQGKAIARAEANVTKGMGREGVAAMRAALATAANTLAKDLESAVDRVEWPGSKGTYGDDVDEAIEKYLRSKAQPIVDGFVAYGYSGHVIDFYDLYDDRGFAPLAKTIRDLDGAISRRAAARKADDDSIVDDLWG